MQDLRTALKLETGMLRRCVTPAELPFENTTEVEPRRETIGQPRACDAVTFGLTMETPGYNLYLSGLSGSGRETTVLEELRALAPDRATPSDWVYVYNFTDPDRPNAIPLPCGRGGALAVDMDSFVAAVQREVPRAFESDDYERRQREVINAVNEKRQTLLDELTAVARANSFVIEVTPAGIMSVPIVNGQPIPPETLALLGDEQRADIEKHGRIVRDAIANMLRQSRLLEKEALEHMGALDREVTLFVINPLLDELRGEYGSLPEVVGFVDQVRDDLLEHYRDLRAAQQAAQSPVAGLPLTLGLSRDDFFARYRVNVLIDNGRTNGAPVVVERNPNWYNLLGRTDYHAALGALVTDFRQIKPGALHRANGGFLVLHVAEVLRQPFAWEALKRALMCREIRIESIGEQYSALPTATLRPEPIPLAVRVILIGTPAMYHMLYALDDDFRDLFKVKAEFAPDMPWDSDGVRSYAAFISRVVREDGLLPFDREAVARVIEHGARLCQDQRRLTTRMAQIKDVCVEATFWARRADRTSVNREDVQQAIEQKIRRANLVEERLHQMIDDGTLAVATTGEQVGQINGIAVLDAGDYAFGNPTRITARVSLGKGEVSSIEREIELSGPIHSKGFMILRGYLAGQYAQRIPLAMSATITFEQSYDEIEGDSASSTELYALLSALADTPLMQGIAVTGSIDQRGNVQAVGGVTDKIKGYFDVCKARGLTGAQGVIIPAANRVHLMLPDDVVNAVDAGQFHIWSVDSVDQGLELLTGVPAGVRGPDDTFPENTIHRRVADRLAGYAQVLQSFNATSGPSVNGAGQIAAPVATTP
jgi:lon-related putative ATP-dependent protease